MNVQLVRSGHSIDSIPIVYETSLVHSTSPIIDQLLLSLAPKRTIVPLSRVVGFLILTAR